MPFGISEPDARTARGDVSQVVSVTALGNGLYAVKFIDMGIEGTRTVRVVCEDGGLKLDSVE